MEETPHFPTTMSSQNDEMTNDEMTTLHTAYFPPISWFSRLWSQAAVALEACENYQKGSVRNRCHIAGPNGEQMLSVPLVKGKHQRTPIREVRIAYDEPWQRQHWRSIRTAYGNAPFFEHYADGLAPFFERRYPFLFDLNLEVVQFFIQKTGWRGEVLFSEKYAPQLLGSWELPRSSTRYPQVFEEKHGFLPDLSMLDLLLCCGKQAAEILASSNPQIHISPPPHNS
jgi:hypothetical protein